MVTLRIGFSAVAAQSCTGMNADNEQEGECLLINNSKLFCGVSIVFTHWGSFKKYHGAVTVNTAVRSLEREMVISSSVRGGAR